MDKQSMLKRAERGIALIFALLSILVLTILAAALVSISMAQTWTALNYRLSTQARYAAEAGVQETMNWLASSNYTAPTAFGSYTMTTNPVTFGGKAVVLSAVSGVSSNYPDATMVSNYQTAAAGNIPNVSNVSYSTYATLLRMTPTAGISWLSGTGGGVMQTWQITSVGTVTGARNATVQVTETFERTGTPVFNYPIEATATSCKAINFEGHDYTDSYNSSTGTYSSQTPGSGGNIATNGNVNLGDDAVINGTILVPNTNVGACPDGVTNGTGSSTFANGTNQLGSSLVTPLPWGCTTTPCYPPGTKITSAQDVSASCASIAGCTKGGLGAGGTGSATSVSITDGGSTRTANVFTLTPGSYGNLTIENADVVHVTAGTYTINSVNFARDGQIVVDSGPVVFNLVGDCASGCPSEAGYSPSTSVLWGAGFAGMNACSGGVTANPDVYGKVTCGPSKTPFSGIPSNFQVVYGGTYLFRVGGMPNAMVSYSPLGAYYAPGAPVGLYGSIVTGTFDDASGSPFHYDSALQNVTQVGQFRPVGGFSWSKF